MVASGGGDDVSAEEVGWATGLGVGETSTESALPQENDNAADISAAAPAPRVILSCRVSAWIPNVGTWLFRV